jgi:hypothetical protein
MKNTAGTGPKRSADATNGKNTNECLPPDGPMLYENADVISERIPRNASAMKPMRASRGTIWRAPQSRFAKTAAATKTVPNTYQWIDRTIAGTAPLNPTTSPGPESAPEREQLNGVIKQDLHGTHHLLLSEDGVTAAVRYERAAISLVR